MFKFGRRISFTGMKKNIITVKKFVEIGTKHAKS